MLTVSETCNVYFFSNPPALVCYQELNPTVSGDVAIDHIYTKLPIHIPALNVSHEPV